MTITMQMEATPLNEMSANEIIDLMDKSDKLRSVLREIADSYDTEWQISDIFRNCPRGVRVDDDYGQYCRLSLNSCSMWEDTDDTYRWAWSVLDNSGYQFSADKCEKIEKYIPVLRGAWTVSGLYVKDKDYNYMSNFVEREIEKMLKEVEDLVNDILSQFDDDGYMLDCLQSCELLDNYYLVDGKVYYIDNYEHISKCVA